MREGNLLQQEHAGQEEASRRRLWGFRGVWDMVLKLVSDASSVISMNVDGNKQKYLRVRKAAKYAETKVVEGRLG
jgi:hypothetical protein